MRKKIVAIVASILCVAIVIAGKINVINSNANNAKDKGVSSQELLEKVLNNPSIIDVYLHNDPTTSINSLKKESEEFSLLQSREDYIETVINKYDKYKLVSDFATEVSIIDSLSYVDNENIDNKIEEILLDQSVKENVEKDITELAKIYFLECLLTSKEVVNSSSEDQIQDIKEVAYDKYLEKEASNLYTGMEETVYELADASNTAKDLGVSINRRGGYATITTPNGSIVDVIISEYFGDRWANTLTMQMKNEYPNAKVLAKADNRYNCHSYAWYKQDTSNEYWLNDPYDFIADGSYKEVNRLAKYDKAIWVELRGGRINFIEHSGIVVGRNSNNVVIVSKWGQGPLMQHTDIYSPYENVVKYYTRNK